MQQSCRQYYKKYKLLNAKISFPNNVLTVEWWWHKNGCETITTIYTENPFDIHMLITTDIENLFAVPPYLHCCELN